MIEETAVGALNYDVLRNILKLSNTIQLGLGAEVGVLAADTSDYLLKEFPKLTMLCIDPWLEYKEVDADRSQAAMSSYETTARNKLSIHGERAQIIKLSSVEAAKIVMDGSLDFVFIDACHDYESVSADIAAWYPKVRKNGIFAGHDYRWPEVKSAVNEFSDQNRISGFVTPAESDVWFFIKE